MKQHPEAFKVSSSDLPRDVVASLGDILAQLWASEHEADLENLILEVNVNRQQTDYSKHANEELILVAANYRLLRFETVIRIILEHLELPWKQAFARTNELLASFSPAVLAWLFFLSRDQSLMRFLVGVQIELEEASDAIALRTDEVKERKLLVKFLNSNTSSIEPLLAAIREEASKWTGRAGSRLYQPYRQAEEAKDRQQIALEEINKTYRRMAEEEFKRVKTEFLRKPRPKINVPLSDSKKEAALDQLLQIHWEAEIEETAMIVLPILYGEKLPSKAYQSFRTHDEKFEAKKRSGKEVSIAEEEFREPSLVLPSRVSGVWKCENERLDSFEAFKAAGLLPATNGGPPASDLRLDLELVFNRVIEKQKTKKTKEAARLIIKQLKGLDDEPVAITARLNRHTRNKILLEIQELYREDAHLRRK